MPGLGMALGILLSLAGEGGDGAPDTEPAVDPTENQTKAAELFGKGEKLFADKNPTEALACFEQSEALSHQASTLFNIGMLHLTLDHPVDAVRALQRALLEPDALGLGDVARANRALEANARRVARLGVESDVPARILVDGHEEGTTPLERPLVLAPGRHVVQVEAAGFPNASRVVALDGGTTASIVLILTRLASITEPVVVRAPAAPTPDPVPRWRRWLPPATVVVGVMTAVVGGAFVARGVSDRWSARSERSALEESAMPGSGLPCDPSGPDVAQCRTDVDRVNARVRNAEVETIAAAGVTVLGLAVTAAGVIWWSRDRHSGGGRERTASWSVQGELSMGGGTLLLQERF